MPDLTNGLLDATRLLFDLQQGNKIAQSFSGCFQPDEIARRVTDGLVEQFNCAFARLWLLEPDQSALKLVASSGLYTHLNGFFGRVPMGAFKVGKIAQNRVSFLSNNLAAEPWVGNREWAIANKIRGFAGYPLTVGDRVIGVLAVFSRHAMEPEFLEVLQTLCTMVTLALDTALHYQKEKQTWQSSRHSPLGVVSLSDQLAISLSSTRLTLVGTEQPLPIPVTYVFLQVGEILNQIGCAYCRLVYGNHSVDLEAIAPQLAPNPESTSRLETAFNEIQFAITGLGGTLQFQSSNDQRAVQVGLKIPYQLDATSDRLQVRCQQPLLQLAFNQLAALAGISLFKGEDDTVPLLTDDMKQLQPSRRIVWVHTGTQPLPKGILAKVDLSASPEDFRQVIKAVNQGLSWGVEFVSEVPPTLSERELEILKLLTQGHRDRDIADRLIISESTVKFHINNVLKKLKAQTRYQALHQVMAYGWIH
ncbi:MAG: LuxR C-terminal-related transcriptional regulator [Leptolyngbyaceae cyanobacterium bins.302]|nr:LuxR C-terminal-related transcriptional regulator [Leptolyngbyaceae cyanobacterium bins.302]